MKRLFLLIPILCAVCFSETLLAQTEIVVSPADAAKHVGEHVTVEGIVVNVFTSKNGNTFVNFGAAYPNQTFTAWIPSSSAAANVSNLDGEKIRVTGKIDLYKGKPEIRVMSQDQIQSEK